MNYSAKCTIKKHGRIWFVYVPPGVVTSINYVAPFQDYNRACTYVRHLIKHYNTKKVLD